MLANPRLLSAWSVASEDVGFVTAQCWQSLLGRAFEFEFFEFVVL